MPRCRHRVGFAVSVLIAAGTSGSWIHAEPTVLFDNGQTQPIPFPSSVNVTRGSSPTAERVVPFQRLDTEALSAARRLPIITPGMSVGRLTPTTVAAIEPALKYLAQTFFVIGSDDYSIGWLQHYHSRLLQLNAVGLLVQAQTTDDLARVRAAGRGLNIAPVSGATLVQSLRLNHYPVLISREGVEQ